MPTVSFTDNLQRHVSCPPIEVRGATVRAALDAAFDAYPTLRGYVLEDDGSVRRHITVWVAGEPVADRRGLTDSVNENDEVYVMQALSGG